MAQTIPKTKWRQTMSLIPELMGIDAGVQTTRNTISMKSWKVMGKGVERSFRGKARRGGKVMLTVQQALKRTKRMMVDG